MKYLGAGFRGGLGRGGSVEPGPAEGRAGSPGLLSGSRASGSGSRGRREQVHRSLKLFPNQDNVDVTSLDSGNNVFSKLAALSNYSDRS